MDDSLKNSASDSTNNYSTNTKDTVHTDWSLREPLSIGADLITIFTLIITFITLLTVRRYKSKVIDDGIINDNLNSLKRLLELLRKYHKNGQKNPIASDSLDNLKKCTNKLKKYGKLLGKRKYKNEVKAILQITEITENNAGQIISDIETIIRIVENDK